MLAGFVFNPIGAHTSDTSLGTAKTLTRPTGANVLRIQAFAQPIRYTLDGTTPTASTGFKIAVGEIVDIETPTSVSIKLIEETASASIQYQWGLMLHIAGNRPART